jgi:hypothetical protein
VNSTSILGEAPILELPVTAKARIVSPFTTQPYQAHTFRELLLQIIPDIAQNAIYVEKTIAQALEPHVGRSVRVSVMGKTQYLLYLEKAFSKLHMKYKIMRNETRTGFHGRSGSGAVAIVGMSGRFPGSESVDELWNGLMAGKEYVSKVSTCHETDINFTDRFGRFRSRGSVLMNTTILLTRRKTPRQLVTEPS